MSIGSHCHKGIAVALFVSAAPLQAQAPPQSLPTFQLEVNYVELLVRVLDEKGNFVRDLQQSDFQLFEDGKRQDISAFSFVDIPFSPPDRSPTPSLNAASEAIASNQTADIDGRLYVFVLDDYFVAPEFTSKVKELVRDFVRGHMSGNDLAALVITSGAGGQNFTRDHSLILKAAERFIGEADSELPADLRAYSVLNSIAEISDWMGSVRGRHKSLIYLSSGGCNFEPANISLNQEVCKEELAYAVGAAQRGGVSIYALDPAGQRPLNCTNAEFSTPCRPSNSLIGPNTPFNGRRVLADDTGGFAVIDTNNFPEALGRIVRENSSYYLLGYYSTNDKPDGKLRKNEVKVNRRGTRLLYRTSYRAPRAPRTLRRASIPVISTDSVNIQLAALLEMPLPMSGMGLHVSGAPFLGADGKTSIVVVVEASGDTLRFTEFNDVYSNDIGLAIAIYDRAGKTIAGERPRVALNLRPESYARASREGVRVVSRITVPPGSYRLWVAGTQAPSGVHGSVMTEIEVPDFSKASLAISGIALASSADAMLTPRSDETLNRAFGAPPVASREFSRAADLQVFTEIYDRRSKPDEVISTIQVKAQDGRVVYQGALERVQAQFGRIARLPLKSLEPGSYVATIEARSTSPKPASVSRSVSFRVR